MRILWALVPLIGVGVLVAFLHKGLSLSPREVPSPLIDKPAPTFDLPLLHQPDNRMTQDDFKGKVTLVNVWASWCVSCRVEHPLLVELARSTDLEIVGLNYKDEPDAARRWLAQLGNPYNQSIMDLDGRTGVDWGVYGVPETFVVDADGMIRHKHIGPVTIEALTNEILPLIRRLRDGSQPQSPTRSEG
jgi:cytochrome c biogenesis protein CcmG/thiol:disulfide interchange protein DsbE